ncbi:class A beta-lactamase [Roseomonas terrae]|uniref:beta-lactamase n=1 Tax=Neoroseomonas terrae TaxID=424799 RepID=A0ABS5EHQ5_9PROT|nr:class A beta-lactamase [Neoroseomonas terrae]MBR0650554.1 class A beta-lactamase [Neoroseomonas terrae]
MIDRRHWMIGAAACLAAGRAAAQGGGADASPARFAGIERDYGGRLGVAVLDSGTGRLVGHRLTERFPMCSTFKAPLTAAVLARVDAGEERLDRRIRVARADLVAHSPVAETRLGGDGMTIAELCAATMIFSDNATANLLLASVGGPSGLTAWLRRTGDAETRLDRTEPALNEALPGDPRDTTTPAAMAATLRRLTLGDALSVPSRAQFVTWLRESRTGDARLRAGLAPGWQVGDRTGTGARGTSNVIGILWPPAGRAPLLVAAYLTEGSRDGARRDAALAAVARAVTG